MTRQETLAIMAAIIATPCGQMMNNSVHSDLCARKAEQIMLSVECLPPSTGLPRLISSAKEFLASSKWPKDLMVLPGMMHGIFFPHAAGGQWSNRLCIFAQRRADKTLAGVTFDDYTLDASYGLGKLAEFLMLGLAEPQGADGIMHTYTVDELNAALEIK
jgi:hypothetical protein